MNLFGFKGIYKTWQKRHFSPWTNGMITRYEAWCRSHPVELGRNHQLSELSVQLCMSLFSAMILIEEFARRIYLTFQNGQSTSRARSGDVVSVQFARQSTGDELELKTEKA